MIEGEKGNTNFANVEEAIERGLRAMNQRITVADVRMSNGEIKFQWMSMFR